MLYQWQHRFGQPCGRHKMPGRRAFPVSCVNFHSVLDQYLHNLADHPNDVRCKGVELLPSSELISAPFSTNRCTVSANHPIQARCNGVNWFLSLERISAPSLSNMRTVSRRPFLMADATEYTSSFAELTSMPRPSSILQLLGAVDSSASMYSTQGKIGA